MKTITSAVLLVSGLGLAACSELGGVTTDQKRQAIFDCKREMGIGGQSQVSVSYASGSGTEVRILPHDQVTTAKAAAINSCAAKKVATLQQRQGRGLRSLAGRLSLPTEYPLLEGDEYLWETMTLEQQERAMLFLASGSSIRSSLEPD